MAEWEPIFEHILKVEGGMRLINVPGDRGGRTFAGISERAHPDWPGWIAIDAGRAPYKDEVKDFYGEKYWDEIAGHQFRDPRVAKMLMSAAVLSGVRRAITLAQQAAETEVVDGIMGPLTVSAIDDIDPEQFMDRFTLARIHRYVVIANKHKSQRKFLRGWMNRAFSEREEAEA